MLRVGRYGAYVERGDERASVPEGLAPDELDALKAEELLAMPSGDRDLGVDPSTGRDIVAKAGRFGPYVTEVLEDGAPKSAKPRTGSLFASMSLDTVTIEDALRLLSLPRVVGVDTEGIEVTAQKGRYGPYLKKGTDSRTLETEEQIFAITIDEALAIYALPKVRGRAAAAPPLRELGPDPVSGEPILLKDGRFGPYVTDGTVNASLRKGDDPNSITPERAAELIADRRLAAPTKKTRKATKKAPAKKAAKKTSATKLGVTTTVKKAAAKKATKKAAAKKTGVGRASAEKAGVGV